MQLAINPLVDCVFKALLGSEDNKPLLIHFLNAVLQRPEQERITEVNILNPYNDREFDTDKLSIVDIKVVDQQGCRYQVEIQLNTGRSLASRITYNWAEIFRQQIQQGQDYSKLKPAVAIWILADNLLPEDISRVYHHHFMFYDPQHNIALTDKASIHTLELKKWHNTDIKTDLDVWSWFFLNAENMDSEQPPKFLQSNLMQSAMDTLKHFKNEEERARYSARLDAWRAQSSLEQDWADDLEDERQKRKEDQESFLGQKEAFLEQIEQLKADNEVAATAVASAAATAAVTASAAAERERLLREKLMAAGIESEI